MTKWLVQNLTHRTTQKHVEDHGATDIQKKLGFMCFSDEIQTETDKYVFSLKYDSTWSYTTRSIFLDTIFKIDTGLGFSTDN